MSDSAKSADGVSQPLEYDGEETNADPLEGDVTRHYWECPSCGFPLCAWMDCPDCGWYDEDAWGSTDTEVSG